MVIQLEQESIGPTLGNIGGILGQALQQRGQRQFQLEEAKRKQREKQASQIYPQLIKGLGVTNIPPDSEQFNILLNRAHQLNELGMDSDKAVSQAIKELESGLGAFAEPMQQQEQPQSPFQQAVSGAAQQRAPVGPIEAIKRGLQSGIGGRASSVLKGEGEKSFQERTGLPEDAGFLSSLLHGGAQIASDLPFYAGGGTLGAGAGTAIAPGIGTVTGAALGAGALPAALNTALSEYQQHLDRGGKGSLEDFILSVGEVGRSGIEGGAEMLSLSTLGKAIGPLKKLSPKMKKLFEMKGGGKALEKVAQSALQTTGVVGAHAAARGELPSKQDVTSTFTQVLGLNLAHISPKIRNNIQEKVAKSGVAPEVFAENLKAEAKKAGQKFSDFAEIFDSIQVGAPGELAESTVGEIIPEKLTPNQQARLNTLVNRVASETPSMLNEKASRLAEENVPSETFELARRRAEQKDLYKKSPELQQEMRAEETRLAEKEEKERTRVKRDTTLKKEADIRKKASKSLPKIESDLRSTNNALREIKDELKFARKSNASQKSINELENRHDRLLNLRDELFESRRVNRGEAKTGDKYETLSEVRERAFKRLEKLPEDIQKKGENVAKRNVLNDMWDLIKGRKEIPGQEKLRANQFAKVREAYNEVYQRELQKIQSRLKNPGLSEKQFLELKTQEGAIKNLLKDIAEEFKVGRRRQGLKDVSRSLESAKEFKGKVSKEAEGKKVRPRGFERFEVPKEKVREAETKMNEEFEQASKEAEEKEKPKTEGGGKEKKAAKSVLHAQSERGVLKNIFDRTTQKLFGITLPGWLTGWIFTGLGVTGYGIRHKAIDAIDSMRMIGLTPREKTLFLSQLKRSGKSPKRIKKIRDFNKRLESPKNREQVFSS